MQTNADSEGGGSPRGTAPFLYAVALVSVLLQLAAAVVWLRWRYTRLEVDGHSMAPTLLNGDFVIADTHAYRHARPAPGDIVVVRDPRVPERELVKRVGQLDPDLGCWVEGDNPDHSTDSRHFGWIPVSAITGRVVVRYWPGLPARIRSDASFSSTSASVGNASGGGSDGSK